MLNVSIKKIALLSVLFLAFSLQAIGQRKWNPRRSRHIDDLKGFHLGFRMGMNYSMFKLKYIEAFTEPELQKTLCNITQVPRVGINLGIITNFKLSENFDLRFIPSVSLEQRNIDYKIHHWDSTARCNILESRKVEAAYMNMPIMIRLKSDFYKVYRVWVSTGFMLSVNMASTKKVANNPKLIKTSPTVISWVIGTGVDLYGEKLKLCPEIRYSLGLNNIYQPKNTEFSQALSRMINHSIVFALNFE